MAERKPNDDLSAALELISSSLRRRGIADTPGARATPRLMTAAQRVAFADDIRSRSKPTDVDSTDLIRRDRDEG